MSTLILDQSLSSSGFIIFDGGIKESGVILTKKENSKKKAGKKNPNYNGLGEMAEKCRRTREVIDGITGLIKKHNVTTLVCEDYNGFCQDSKAADALATARTVVCGIAHMLDIEFVSIPARKAKAALTGNNKASKDEMVLAAAKRAPRTMSKYKSSRAKIGFNGNAEHVADAIGIYMAYKTL